MRPPESTSKLATVFAISNGSLSGRMMTSVAMQMRAASSIMLALVMTLGLLGSASAETSNLPRIGVDFTFGQKHKCQGISPEIRLSNVPAGVTSYEVKLTDLDVPTFHHWSQTLLAGGPVIREGAGAGYFGPCPPSGTHRYEITVVARDGQNRAVASGEKIVVSGR